MKTEKKFTKNAILLAVILIVVLYFSLKDNFVSVMNTLLKTDFRWIAFAIVFIFIYWLLRALCLYMIAREYSKNLKFSHMFQLTLITQFFNGITPFSSGGQPMEVYYMSKAGIKPTKGTNIILQEFIMYQMALIVHGMLAIGLNYYFHFFKEVPVLKELTLIGFIINTLVGVGLLFISFSTKFNNTVMQILVKLCHKLKIVKDKDKAIEKWSIRLDEFHESALLLKSKKILFLKGFVYNFLALAAYYIIPLFVIYGMRSFDINAIETMAASAYVLIIGAFVPIPGGSGGIEYGYMQFFGNFVTGSFLSASMLVWRFVTYYLGMILGAITLNFFKGIKGDVKE